MGAHVDFSIVLHRPRASSKCESLFALSVASAIGISHRKFSLEGSMVDSRIKASGDSTSIWEIEEASSDGKLLGQIVQAPHGIFHFCWQRQFAGKDPNLARSLFLAARRHGCDCRKAWRLLYFSFGWQDIVHAIVTSVPAPTLTSLGGASSRLKTTAEKYNILRKFWSRAGLTCTRCVRSLQQECRRK